MSEGVQGNREAISAPVSDAPPPFPIVASIGESVSRLPPHPFPPIVRLVADEL